MSAAAVLDRLSTQIGYCAGAAVLALAVSALPGATYSLALTPFVVALIYLGPLGLAAKLITATPISILFTVPRPVEVGITVVFAVGIAWVNATAWRRWRASPRGRAAFSPHDRLNAYGCDYLGGALAFSLAGCAFLWLAWVTGFSALLADGFGGNVTEAEAAQVRLIAGVTGWAGFAIAVAGLMLWVGRVRRAKPLLMFAVLELGCMIALIIIFAATA